MMIGLLFPLALIGVVVWLVHNRRSGMDGAGSEHTPRRVLQYSFLLASLFTAAVGITRLLATALPNGEIASRRSVDVALGLSLTIVAVPVWLLLWRLAVAHLRREPEERAAPAWGLYVVAAATVSLVVAVVQLVRTGQWLVGVEPYDPDALAASAVWVGVWLGQTWLVRRPALAPTGRSPHLAAIAGSGVGLVMLAIGTGTVFRYAFEQLYRLVAGDALVPAAPTEDLRTGLVVTALAALVWWWHWLRHSLAGPRGDLWIAYVLLVAVFGGLATVLVSGGILLHAVLQWLIGEPESARAATHFEQVPGAAAAMLTGGWVWWYHRAVLDEAVQRRRAEPERVYGYLGSGIGLLAAAGGIAVAITAAIQALAPAPIAAEDASGRNALAVALTLLVVGGPLWAVFWRRLSGFARTGPVAERQSVSRRLYLFVLFGLTGLTAVVSLAVVLFVLFRELLEGTLTAMVLHDIRVAIGLVITAGAVSAYHWTVYRADREVRSQEAGTRRRSVVLVSTDGQRLAAAVADGTGARVRRLRRLDGAAPGGATTEVDPAEVNAAILASGHDHLLVTVEDDGRVHVIPYEAV